MTVTILTGDARDMLATLPTASVQCAVTSPPYFGLRDYQTAGQIGCEQTPEAYVAALVGVFQEMRRVLADDGTFWLVIGDSYAANRGYQVSDSKHKSHDFGKSNAAKVPPGLKPKDLLMIPARVALALQAEGWYLRSHIIWHKPNAMPESVRDRPTNCHESVFLFAKQDRYYYDAEAIKEAAVSDHPSGNGFKRDARLTYRDENGARGNDAQWTGVGGLRNARNVWTINTKPYSGGHFATFPPGLAERCIKAGSRPGDTVLDPFFGAGTTALAAAPLGRDCIGIELNPAYVDLARERLGLAATPQLDAAD